MSIETADPQTTPPARFAGIDFSGVLSIEELATVLRTSDETIRRRLKDGTFPIPPLPSGIDIRFRWYGPRVLRWLEENGGGQ